MQTARARRDTMAKADLAWLRMEQPDNLMMITGVMILAAPLDLDTLRQRVAQRFRAYPRFRQRPVDLEVLAYWETDPGFDLSWHVQGLELPGSAGERELQQRVGELASTPLDTARPLWQFHLLADYLGGSAVVARIHHCYADGLALVQVLRTLTDPGPDFAAPVPDDPPPWPDQHEYGDGGGLFGPVIEQFGQAVQRVEEVMKRTSGLLRKGLDLYHDPARAVALARDGGDIVAELAQALALPDDHATALQGPLGGSKRCAWAEPLDLDEVKAVGRGYGCSVNDVLLSVAAGALRGHLLERGDALDGVDIRAMTPVNLRRSIRPGELGNQFGLVFLDLPIGEADPVQRLRQVHRNMDRLKASRQAQATCGALAALGMSASPVQRAALDFLTRKASLVATNVPGPRKPLYLAGRRIDRLMFWVPQSGRIGTGISLFSHQGRVHFGLIADAERIPDPADVTRRFKPEFERLLYTLLMSEWEVAGEG
ncbi:MAG: wax ester/triacylglycerol synthase family O-acyltransferase [Lysobacteraceae bacterium]